MSAVNTGDPPDPLAMQDEVLGPLVRVIEEAADHGRWALIGAAACRLQGAEAYSPNLEFMTTEAAVDVLADMLDIEPDWRSSERLAARRLHFMRGEIPVFVFGNPVFHGNYESLSPIEVPSLWDARVRVRAPATSVMVTPVEWELLLAVVLGMNARIASLGAHLRERGADTRLLIRLMREGRVQPSTEDAVWAVLEQPRAERDDEDRFDSEYEMDEPDTDPEPDPFGI